MWKTVALLTALVAPGCASQSKPPPTVKADDPVMPLNGGLWNEDVNTLVKPAIETGDMRHG